MISYETWKLVHLVGLLLVFLGFGGMLMGSRDGASPRPAMILHGLGVLVLLVAGFCTLVQAGIRWPWPGWIWAKIVAWLLIGALPVLYKRRVAPGWLVGLIAIAIGASAAWLAISTPF